jgi:hypothetical protein
VEKGDKNGEKENDEEKHGSICWREFFFYMMAVVLGMGAPTSPWVELCLFSQCQK